MTLLRINRFILVSFCLLATCITSLCFAGDDASGDVHRKLDLSAKYKLYSLTKADHQWINSLIKNLHYQADVMLFSLTDLPLESMGAQIEGKVYQSLEDTELFYVSDTDVMLKIGEKHPFSPGVGGFSMHADNTKQFIVCLHCLSGGVLVRHSTPVSKGIVEWYGRKVDRLAH